MKTFADVFNGFASFDLEWTEQPKAASVSKILIDRIRKIEKLHRFKEPTDLLARVDAQFKRYASRGDDLSQAGPWSYWMVASSIDPAGALRVCANVVKAEIEGVMPERWTS